MIIVPRGGLGGLGGLGNPPNYVGTPKDLGKRARQG